MATLITVRHNFETAHRLPFLQGKCENLHGHSWWAEFEIENLKATLNGVDSFGISAEYGSVKKTIRNWIDTYLDHGTMLGAQDPLYQAELHHGGHAWGLLGKVFLFGYSGPDKVDPQEAADFPHPSTYFSQRPWPTVESVAFMLCHKIQTLLGNDLFVNKVTVQETHVNKAIYLQGV
jgi:6-pyruvoyltetrahydropterin/6-carboxytetrahydropterin synthase